MVYTTGTIKEIKSGAELGGIVHDQWIHFKTDGANIWLFDEDMICPAKLEGKRVEVKIGVLPLDVKLVDSGSEGFLGKRQLRGRIKERRGDLWLLNVNEIILLVPQEDWFRPGQLVEFEGRLNLLEIKNQTSGWKNV